MGAGITLWIRAGSRECEEAQLFLRSHNYAADQVRDLPSAPPRPFELDALVKGLGGKGLPLVNPRHETYGTLFPQGVEDLGPAALNLILCEHPSVLKAPLLLTPRGALAGFRETQWRAFFGIGLGHS